MDPTYGARYARLYRTHWWWRAREEYLTRLLDRLVGVGGASDVLDFGCGDGLLFPILQRYGSPVGIEPDATLLDPLGPWRDRISNGPLLPDPAESARHGLIVALDVLEHIEDPRPVLTELRRRLRPGGWFVATVPAFPTLWTTHDDLNHHFRRYRVSELETSVRASGLEIIESRYLFVWLAVVKWVVARTQRFARPDVRPPDVPPGPINAAMLAFCRVEQRLLGSTRPPFGSSAVIVARAPC